MADITLSGFGDNIFAGSISADRIAYNDAVGFYDPKLVTNPNRLTNADRIRAMSDEELAVFFNNDFLCPPGYATADGMLLTDKCVYHNDTDDEPCRRCWLDWLKQEVEI